MKIQFTVQSAALARKLPPVSANNVKYNTFKLIKPEMLKIIIKNRISDLNNITFRITVLKKCLASPKGHKGL